MEKKSSLNNYVLLKTLGAGYNSKVKLGCNKNNGEYTAVKIIKNSNNMDSNLKAILNEAQILQQLDHPNIIKIYELSDQGHKIKKDGTEKKGILYAVLELATNGEIFEYLSNTGRFSEPVTRYYFKQLIGAQDQCHSKGFAHRDLKPENLLLDDQFNLKLADFGFATLLAGKDNTGKLKTILGTESYMAPEIHMKASYYHGILVDLFAAGIILFIMITGHPPFNCAKPKDPYYNMICTNRHDRFWAAHSKKKPNGEKFFTEEFKSLINAMLAFDPTQRPSIAEIITHPWFEGQTSTSQEIYEEFKARKMKVDEAVEKERIAEQQKKEQQKMAAQNQNPNFMFNAIGPAFRGNDKKHRTEEDEMEQEANEKLWNEVQAKMADMSLPERLPLYTKTQGKPGTTYWSGLPSKSFFETCFYVSEKIGNSTTPCLEKSKFNVTKTLDEGKLEFDVKLFTDNDGFQLCEFIKKMGPLMDFYDVCSEFKREMGVLEGKGQDVEAEAQESA